MSKAWRFRPEAEREIDDAIAWYEDQQVGRGEHFVQALRAVMVRLAEMSSLGGPVPQSRRGEVVRRYLMQRYPYAVVFVELEHEYQVLAVAHVRRRPRYWTSRLKKPSP